MSSKSLNAIAIFLLMALLPLGAWAQQSTKALEAQLDTVYGLTKIKTLNQLTDNYLGKDVKKANKYNRQALRLIDNVFQQENAFLQPEDWKVRAEVTILLGKISFAREKYLEAHENLYRGLEFSKRSKYNPGIATASQWLAKTDSAADATNLPLPDFSKIQVEEDTAAKKPFASRLKGLQLGKKIVDAKVEANIASAFTIGQNFEKQGYYEKAIKQYEKAANLAEDLGDAERIAEMHGNIAAAYKKAGNTEKALEYYDITLSEQELVGDTATMRQSLDSIRQIYGEIANEQNRLDAMVLFADSTELAEAEEDKESFKSLAASAEEQKDYRKSLEYYKQYVELDSRLREQKRRHQLALLSKTHELENKVQQVTLLQQQKNIQSLEINQQEVELAEQQKFRTTLIACICLAVALLFLFYFLFITKRRAHNNLQVAYTDLDETRNELVVAEEKIKTLLKQQVSPEIAETLLATPSAEVQKVERKFVCVMFLDIRGFTPFAEKLEPEELIAYQNDVFGFMIDIIDKHHGNINQFLGDGFMATFGVPFSFENDCQNAYDAALKIIEEVNRKSESGAIPATKIGIGMHAGSVVAGNVGTDVRKQYSVTGNTVIIAARIEQLNKQYGSQLVISEELYDKLDTPPTEQFDQFVEVQIKGRSTVGRVLAVV